VATKDFLNSTKSFLGKIKEIVEGQSDTRSDSTMTGETAHGSVRSEPASGGKYSAILKAIEATFSDFLKTAHADHVEIEPDDVYAVTSVKLSSTGDGKSVLDDFFREFKPVSRMSVLNKIVTESNARDKLSLELLTGFEIEIPSADPRGMAAENSEADLTEFLLNKQLGQPTNVVNVRIVGRWVARELIPDPAKVKSIKAPGDAVAPSIAGVAILLRIEDASSKPGEHKSVRVNRYPAVIGLNADCDVPISASYVSGRHLRLDWQEGQGLTATDLGSTNGTFLGGQKLEANVAVRVKDGALIQLSESPTGGALIVIRVGTPVLQPPSKAGTTPGATPIVGATPLVKDGTLKQHTLAWLEVEDAEGNRRIAVQRLPFRVGRSSDCDYVTPKANGSISRNHLTLVRLLADGFQVEHGGFNGNGTTVKNKLMGEYFMWGFATELVLGGKNPEYPTCKITLRKPSL